MVEKIPKKLDQDQQLQMEKEHDPNEKDPEKNPNKNPYQDPTPSKIDPEREHQPGDDEEKPNSF